MMPQRHTRRGIVFLTALVALTVMLIIAVTFINLSLAQLHDATRDLRALHASAMADAGINYMIWNQKYPNQSQGKIVVDDVLPATTDYRTLEENTASPALRTSSTAWGEDQYAVWLVKYTLPTSPVGTLDGYQVISKGTFRGYTRTLRALLRAPAPPPPSGPETNPPPPPVLDHALFSGTGLTVGGNTKVFGKVGCNLDLNVNSGSAVIYGDTAAGGIVTAKNPASITGLRLQHQPQIILSDIINMANLYAYAASHGGEVYTGSKSFWGNETVNNRVIYVKGDVTINANTVFSGVVTIVAEGNVTINGNTSSVGPSDMSNLFVISPNTVTFKVNGNANIYSTIIAPGVESEFSGLGTANIIGAVLSNRVDASGSFNIIYRKPNTDAVIVPPPPVDTGDDSLAWSLASWEKLN